ncbi:MAG: 2'-deoxycytidine 5'-triphosphate deaminase [Cyclonatronaceae bacterium]
MELRIRKKGILPVQQLRLLMAGGIIQADKDYAFEQDQLQPNSVDLRLGRRAYRVRCGFLPETERVDAKIEKLYQHSFSIEEGGVLEPNCTYIIPLLESVALPGLHVSHHQLTHEAAASSPAASGQNGVAVAEKPDTELLLSTEHQLSARTNPKRTTGRLDIFTRLITDYSHRFDEITPGYCGPLYLEVVPKSFPVRVKTGQRLNQLRIRHGNGRLSDEEILRAHTMEALLYNETQQALPQEMLKTDTGLFMSVDLQGDDDGIVGYRARKNSAVVDLEKIGYYDRLDFWEPVYANAQKHIILEPEAFYIFASKEYCRIPGFLAGEMVPYDTGSGELRTHYAGFFDSGFGQSGGGGGARAVLEVRSHDVPFLVEDGQTFFSMMYEANTEIPEFIYGDDIKSNYQGQSLKLSKHFK